MPREVGSGLNAEIAFPMFVRATLVGALIVPDPAQSPERLTEELHATLAELLAESSAVNLN